MLELPGSAKQLQPVGHAPGILMRLCRTGASGGAGSVARPWGAALQPPHAAPRHSPHCQRVSSTVTRRRRGPAPACRPHGARTEPETSSAQRGGGRREEAFPDSEQRDTSALSPATGSASTTAPLHTTQLHCGNLFWSPQAPQQLFLITQTTLAPRDNVLLLSTDKHPPTPQPLHIPRVSGWRDGAPGPSSATDPH